MKKRRKPSAKPLYMDSKKKMHDRIEDLLNRMSLEEKISQMVNQATPIPRLGVPAYDWWNEALHGVARAGRATVFPQAIGLGATFDPELVKRVAVAISDEGRAKFHAAQAMDNRLRYMGLTFWSPNVNIFRDPRWGRGHETYGEDPFLTSRMGVAFVQGIQGHHPRYLKAAACAKHYAVHSGPESLRHQFDAKASKKDMVETYLPAFKACVQEAKVESVMGAYNRTNGEPCCASPTLLKQILRDEWGFQGHVVSDCGAIQDIHQYHGVTKSPAESAALAVRNGCDLNCGVAYDALRIAVERNLIREDEIDNALRHLLRTRFKLGMFDPPNKQPYARISTRVLDCFAHRKLARKAAQKSMVLLKNNGILPLKKNLRMVTVVGPNAASQDVLLGNYFGLNPTLVTVLEGVVGKVTPATRINYSKGCDLFRPMDEVRLYEAEMACSDVIVAVMGLSPELEGEQGDAYSAECGGDRTHLDLPGSQLDVIKALKKFGPPVVLVLACGSAVTINWAQENVDAIVQMWYPGEEGGNALADVLFGDYNPAGRLPVTFVKSMSQLPEFTDYSMKNRTYRYLRDDPLYPFGFGLSYAHFQYGKIRLSKKKVKPGQGVAVEVTVRNVGKVAGDEVVQLYLSDLHASVDTPICQLKGLERIHLRAGQGRKVRFQVTPEMMMLVDEEGKTRLEPGRFRVTIGGCVPGRRGQELGASKPSVAEFEIVDE